MAKGKTPPTNKQTNKQNQKNPKLLSTMPEIKQFFLLFLKSVQSSRNSQNYEFPVSSKRDNTTYREEPVYERFLYN